jgi:hypothetical protein
MRMSWTEIAVQVAEFIAQEKGCELQSFSLDGAETDMVDGVEVVHLHASARLVPLSDDIPFDEPETIPFDFTVAAAD